MSVNRILKYIRKNDIKRLYSIDGGEYGILEYANSYNYRYTVKHIMILDGEEIDVYTHNGLIVERNYNYYFIIGYSLSLNLKGSLVIDKVPMFTSELIAKRTLKINKLVERINQNK